MTEKKYIDADSVIKDLRRIVAEPWNRQAAPASWAEAYEDLIDILESEPAADVRPAKRGEWKKRQNWSRCVCSVCSWESGNVYNFCPNCGADMRKQDD